MASKRDSLKKKKREKQKKKREQIRRDGGASRPGSDPRQATGAPGRAASLEQAALWPVGEVHISADWHERGAHVHASFTRRRPDGRVAAAFVEVDLRERGVVAVKTTTSLNDDTLIAHLGRRSDDEAMVGTDPRLVVRVVDEGSRHGAASGHAQPRALDDARALFGDIDATDYDVELLLGEEPVEPRGPGLLGTIKGWFTREEAPEEAEDPTAPEA